jgi:Kef-type K+ transport system membrane component KefB
LPTAGDEVKDNTPHRWSYHPQAGFAAIVIVGAIPLWITLSPLVDLKFVRESLGALSILLGYVQGLVLVSAISQIWTAAGREEVDVLVNSFGSSSLRTKLITFAVLIGIPLNWFLLFRVPQPFSWLLFKVCLVFTLAPWLKAYLFGLIDRWSGNSNTSK